MNIDYIKKQMREKRRTNHAGKKNVSLKSHPKMFSFVLKVMVLCVMFLGVLIYTKSSSENKQLFYDALLKDNLSFATINDFYNKYLGGILPFKDIVKDNKPVFKEKLVYSESNIYKDGVALNVEKSYLVPSLDSGIVVFVGEKEDYGKTIIIQQVNGVDVWYGNIDNLTVKIYDYVEGGSLIGETISDKLYLIFKKEGKAVDYKEYLQ